MRRAHPDPILVEIAKRLSEEDNAGSTHSYRISPSIMEKLHAGEHISNHEFDQIFPLRYRVVSSIQWSPIIVAQTIAKTLRPREGLRLLDIGAGVGKLCALLSIFSDFEIVGVEQRKSLVKIAKRVALENSLKMKFIHGDMLDMDWNEFDALYFYNPFQEHRYGAEYARIDDAIEYDLKMFHQYVAEVKKRVSQLSPGKLVITYHGFGGTMPKCMKMIRSTLIEEGGHLSFFERINEEA